MLNLFWLIMTRPTYLIIVNKIFSCPTHLDSNFITLAGLPATIENSGASLVKTLPAPTTPLHQL